MYFFALALTVAAAMAVAAAMKVAMSMAGNDSGNGLPWQLQFSFYFAASAMGDFESGAASILSHLLLFNLLRFCQFKHLRSLKNLANRITNDTHEFVSAAVHHRKLFVSFIGINSFSIILQLFNCFVLVTRNRCW